jgi:hypothetical protein
MLIHADTLNRNLIFPALQFGTLFIARPPLVAIGLLRMALYEGCFVANLAS